MTKIECPYCGKIGSGHKSVATSTKRCGNCNKHLSWDEKSIAAAARAIVAKNADSGQHRMERALVIGGLATIVGIAMLFVFPLLVAPCAYFLYLGASEFIGGAMERGFGWSIANDDTPDYKYNEFRNTRPCPQCAEPLKSSEAKQCLKCAADWH